MNKIVLHERLVESGLKGGVFERLEGGRIYCAVSGFEVVASEEITCPRCDGWGYGYEDGSCSRCWGSGFVDDEFANKENKRNERGTEQ